MSAKPKPLTDYERRAEASMIDGMQGSWFDRRAAVAKELEARDALVAALNALLVGNPQMESMLWGDFPDTALVTSSYPLSALRQARAALALAEAG